MYYKKFNTKNTTQIICNGILYIHNLLVTSNVGRHQSPKQMWALTHWICWNQLNMITKPLQSPNCYFTGTNLWGYQSSYEHQLISASTNLHSQEPTWFVRHQLVEETNLLSLPHFTTQNIFVVVHLVHSPLFASWSAFYVLRKLSNILLFKLSSLSA